jgi:hypothetical protein
MKVTPQITADVDEYPELRRLLNIALRPIVDIMSAHAIASVRRMRKVGVFDHPYVKDVVSPMNITAVPRAIMASQYTVGQALLDYLEAIGVTGVTVEASDTELREIANVWMPEACNVKPSAKNQAEQPKPETPETPETEKPDQDTPAAKEQPTKEAENGEQANN